MPKFTANIILLLAIIFTLFTYGFIYVIKQMPTGDETITYLCATGNQGTYEVVNNSSGMYGKITNSSDWQQFFEIKESTWTSIAQDLTQTDLHPPFYFWLLQQVIKVVQPIFKAGLLLNLLLHLISIYILFQIGKSVGLTKRTASMVVLFWSLSPAIVSIGFAARQYELLGVINLLTVFTFIKFEKDKHKLWLLLLLAALMMGVLTHYLYLYFMFAYVGYVIFLKRDVKTTLVVLGLIILAVASLYLLHPGVIAQFGLQQQRAQDFNVLSIPIRGGKVLISLIQIVFPVLSLKTLLLKLPIWLVSLGVLLLLAGLIWITRNRHFIQYVAGNESKNKLISWLLLCSLLLSIVPYLFFLTPLHAMGGQYLVLVYPFLLLTVVPRLSENILLNKWAIMVCLAGTILQLLWLSVQQQGYHKLFQQVEQADMICVNSKDRRGFLRLVPYLKNQKVLMYEQVKPCELISEGKLLFIADQATKSNARAYLFDANEYDLGDGVVFYTQVIDAAFCEQLHEK